MRVVEVLSIVFPRTRTFTALESAPLLPSKTRTFRNKTTLAGGGVWARATQLSTARTMAPSSVAALVVNAVRFGMRCCLCIVRCPAVHEQPMSHHLRSVEHRLHHHDAAFVAIAATGLGNVGEGVAHHQGLDAVGRDDCVRF